MLISCWADMQSVVTTYSCCFQKEKTLVLVVVFFSLPQAAHGNHVDFNLCWCSPIHVQDYHWMKFITFQWVNYLLQAINRRNTTKASCKLYSLCQKLCEGIQQRNSWVPGQAGADPVCAPRFEGCLSGRCQGSFLCCRTTRKWLADSAISFSEVCTTSCY